jgi:hypothetical protein
MFVRTKRSVRNGTAYEYLQIVRSYRDGGRVRQQVLATLGRRDELVASGEIDQLLQSLGRFSQNLKVIEGVRTQNLRARESRLWGPPLVFGRLWETQGLPEILRYLARDRKFQFDVERACFAMALQRLCCPGFGSDLQGSAWIHNVEAERLSALELQHFYRTAAFLFDVRHALEGELFFKDRDLFTQSLDVVFVDTTSTYVYRDEETKWRKRGYSRDRRGDLPQFVLCVVVDQESWPIAWEIMPGNTADAVAMRQVIALLRERFKIRRVIVVADRGMIGKGVVGYLTSSKEAPFEYVLGCRLRQDKTVRDEVLQRPGSYETVNENLEVKEVGVENRRYVICRNPVEARKDAAARTALIKKLEDTLSQHGPKAVIANRGFARFVKVQKNAVSIDREAISRDELLDGKFVLTTNTDLTTAEVAMTYKSLWRVERTFREEKSTLEVRPIFHHRDDTSIGHIVACFLALRLEVDLQRRLDERGCDVSWPDLMRDLSQVQAVILDLDGQRYRARSDLRGGASQAFAAAGVRPPSAVTHLGPAPPDEAADQEIVV